MNTTEINKTIGIFMDGEYLPKAPGKLEGFKFNDKNLRGFWEIEDMQYHNSYSWIMPVVDKINALGYEVLIGRISCQVNEMLKREEPIVGIVCGDTEKKLQIIVEAVFKFIQYYNENK